MADTTMSNSPLASLFECPVCLNHVLPPITQCQNGHLICNDCRPKLARCPACRVPLRAIRNLAMEKVAEFVLFPCRYASSGCGATMPPTEKAAHEEHCEFRPCCCPYPRTSCQWQGSMDAVVPHLRQHCNNTMLTLQGEAVILLATSVHLPGNLDWVMLQSCFGFQFILALEKLEIHDDHQKFLAVVQLIGTRQQAERFTYQLELSGNNKRQLMWEATPLCIHQRIATAFRNNECLVFYSGVAERYTENGDLRIFVTISMS